MVPSQKKMAAAIGRLLTVLQAGFRSAGACRVGASGGNWGIDIRSTVDRKYSLHQAHTHRIDLDTGGIRGLWVE